MDESITQNNIGIENASVEKESNASCPSTDAFSVSIDPFNSKEYKYNQSKISIENFIRGYINLVPKYEWDIKVLPMVKIFNNTCNPQISEEDLNNIYSLVLNSIDESKTFNLQEIVNNFKKNKTEATYQIAEYIVSKYNIITIGEHEREMFVYKDGMYYAGAENLIIYPEIQKVLGSLVTKNAKSETFHKIADMTVQQRSVFCATPIKYIPLSNGVYNFETGELLPHDSGYKFKYKMPVMYDPTATCPKTEAFLDQILTPRQRIVIEEWLGYYFWRDYRFKKAMVLVGEGDTGKTTLLEVITYLIGRENIANISLQKMTGDKFAAAHLYEKHGNLVDELSAKDISDTDAFKMATGNGSVTGEYKFGNQFSFQNFAKLTYACNRIPDMADNNDDAYFNRWIVIRFENTIKVKIPNFIETLTTDEERSGLFNLAMKGLRRLLDQKGFTYTNNAEETKLEMMRSGSSIAMFASDMLERFDDGEMSKEDMYEEYINYCKLKKLPTQTKDNFGKKLSNYATFIADGQMYGMNDKGKPTTVRCWRNVKIKGRVDKTEEIFQNF